MFIDFERYPFKITSVSFDASEDWFDNYPSILKLETDGGKAIVLKAVGDCCSCSVFRIWENYNIEKMVGKTLISFKEIDIPDNFVLENNDEDDDLYLTDHLYEFAFSDSDETFKIMLVNYSNGYYDGWIAGEVVDL